jgi:hypothetical protein
VLNKTQIVRAPVAQVRYVRLRRETNGMLFVLPTVLVLLAIIRLRSSAWPTTVTSLATESSAPRYATR